MTEEQNAALIREFVWKWIPHRCAENVLGCKLALNRGTGVATYDDGDCGMVLFSPDGNGNMLDVFLQHHEVKPWVREVLEMEYAAVVLSRSA